eukprot:491858_1
MTESESKNVDDADKIIENKDKDDNEDEKQNENQVNNNDIGDITLANDKWDENILERRKKLECNEQIIKHIVMDDAVTIFGQIIATNSTITKWNIKIIKLGGNKKPIMIGIVESKRATLNMIKRIGDYPYGYGYNSKGYIYNDKKKKKYGKQYKDTDIITVCLDLNNYTLSYYLNNMDLGIAYKLPKNKKKDYKVAVSTYHIDDEFELL